LDLPINRVDGYGLVADDDLVGGWLGDWSLLNLERNDLLAGDPCCVV